MESFIYWSPLCPLSSLYLVIEPSSQCLHVVPEPRALQGTPQLAVAAVAPRVQVEAQAAQEQGGVLRDHRQAGPEPLREQ